MRPCSASEHSGYWRADRCGDGYASAGVRRSSRPTLGVHRSGLQPDLLGDAGWWQTPLWQYAVFAFVIYSRAAAERLALPLDQIARQSAARHDLELPHDGWPR